MFRGHILEDVQGESIASTILRNARVRYRRIIPRLRAVTNGKVTKRWVEDWKSVVRIEPCPICLLFCHPRTPTTPVRTRTAYFGHPSSSTECPWYLQFGLLTTWSVLASAGATSLLSCFLHTAPLFSRVRIRKLWSRTATGPHGLSREKIRKELRTPVRRIPPSIKLLAPNSLVCTFSGSVRSFSILCLRIAPSP